MAADGRPELDARWAYLAKKSEEMNNVWITRAPAMRLCVRIGMRCGVLRPDSIFLDASAADGRLGFILRTLAGIKTYLASDLEPRAPTVKKEDFREVDVSHLRSVADKVVLGFNPPFGRKAKLASDYMKRFISELPGLGGLLLVLPFVTVKQFPQNYRIVAVARLERDDFVDSRGKICSSNNIKPTLVVAEHCPGFRVQQDHNTPSLPLMWRHNLKAMGIRYHGRIYTRYKEELVGRSFVSFHTHNAAKPVFVLRSPPRELDGIEWRKQSGPEFMKTGRNYIVCSCDSGKEHTLLELANRIAARISDNDKFVGPCSSLPVRAQRDGVVVQDRFLFHAIADETTTRIPRPIVPASVKVAILSESGIWIPFRRVSSHRPP